MINFRQTINTANKEIEDQLIKATQDLFPIKYGKYEVKLNKLSVDNKFDPYNFADLKKSKYKNRTAGNKLYAWITLYREGKPIEKRKILITTIPQMTALGSFIIKSEGGMSSDYVVSHQMRLKPGAYSFINENGEITTHINPAPSGNVKLPNMKIILDPETKRFLLKIKTRNIPLYSVLRFLGYDDSEIKQFWPTEIFQANKDTNLEKDIKSLCTSIGDLKGCKDKFIQGKLDPSVLKENLGIDADKLEPKVLLAASKKLIDILNDKAEEDDEDDITNKTMLNTADMIREYIENSMDKIKGRIVSALKKNNPTLERAFAQKPIESVVLNFFRNNDLSKQPEATNPLATLSESRQLTMLGKMGGIGNVQKIKKKSTLIHPSHIGFIDPIQTPESKLAGINLYLPLDNSIQNRQLRAKVITPSGKETVITPEKAKNFIIAMPDSWRQHADKVEALVYGKEIKRVPRNQIDYIFESPLNFFSIGASLVPFLNSDQGNRSNVASRQVQQAVALKYREPPLVRSSHIGARAKDDLGKSMESILGEHLSIKSPVDGKITKITDDYIYIKSGKQSYKVPLFSKYPLNEQSSAIDADIVVKVGDTVKKGQLLADSSFTKNGILSTGINLNVAYMPYKGYNYEDGIVITESAAKKLTSKHIYRIKFTQEEGTITDKHRWLMHFGITTKPETYKNIGKDGIIKAGSKINPGDFLVLSMKRAIIKGPVDQVLTRLGKHVDNLKDISIKWDKHVPGKVINVTKNGNTWILTIETEEPAEVGDKIVGRHGNKGVIIKIIPDNEAPKTKDGKRVDVLFNPLGVPGRINMGQMLETLAGKVAEKTGKPTIVPNFGEKSNRDFVINLAKKHNVEEKEYLVDPTTGKQTEVPIAVGKQYFVKLKHMASKKMNARGAVTDADGNPLPYTSELQPGRGSPRGGMKVDSLTTYALLSHGVPENLREIYTVKSEYNREFWKALQEGLPLPPLKKPFAYKKFEHMLKAVGIDPVEKDNKIILKPLLDSDIIHNTTGELLRPELMFKEKGTPYREGLFDPIKTGGPNGNKMARITLATRMPNPVFEGAIISLLGIKSSEFHDIMDGTKCLDKSTDKIESYSDNKNCIVANEAIEYMLSKIDVGKELSEAEKSMEALKTTDMSDKQKATMISTLNKKIRILRALKKFNLTPLQAYTIKHIPVIPPIYRPVIADSSMIQMDDLNNMYRWIGAINSELKTDIFKKLPNKQKAETVSNLYDMLKAMEIDGVTNSVPGLRTAGVVNRIAGLSPKTGFFQKKLIQRRQEMSGRAVITVNPDLPIDNIEIPEDMAWHVYKPLILRIMVNKWGARLTDAMNQIKRRTPLAKQALDEAIASRPVLLKRDPVLHKESIQAFYPLLTKEKTIKIPTMITKGFNADFDGDQMTMYVPATDTAAEEAKKMLPSNNIMEAGTFDFLYLPSHEAVAGLYVATMFKQKVNKHYNSINEILKDYATNKLKTTDIIILNGKQTTPGRVAIYNIIKGYVSPQTLNKVLYDKSYLLNKNRIKELAHEIYDRDKKAFPDILNKLKRLGENISTYTLTFGVTDIPDINKKVLEQLEKKVDKLDDTSAIDLVTKVTNKIYDNLANKMKDNPLFVLLNSGARVNPSQAKQLIVAPGMVLNSFGQPIKYPITKSYSEGLTLGQYVNSLQGARKGIVDKTVETADPGYLAKQLANTMIDTIITMDDCGTTDGIAMNIEDTNILYRFVATTVKTKSGKILLHHNDLVTPSVVSMLKQNKVTRIIVRSPLTCKAPTGICAHCYGLDETGELPKVGEHVGIKAALSLTEPATQLSMKTFHEGGVAGSAAARGAQSFKEMRQFFDLPRETKNDAIISPVNGTITKIENPIGSINLILHVGGDKIYVPKHKKLLPNIKIGAKISKGDQLTEGVYNLHKALDLTNNVRFVQHKITDYLYNTYKSIKPIRKTHIELVARRLTDVVEIIDPGSVPGILPGDRVRRSLVEAYNSGRVPPAYALGLPLAKDYGKYKKGTVVTEDIADNLIGYPVIDVDVKHKIQYKPIMVPIRSLPLTATTDWATASNFERIKDTLKKAFWEGWEAPLHGLSPIPDLITGLKAEYGNQKSNNS